MSSVLEIESAIAKLPESELKELSEWWENHLNSRRLSGEGAKSEAIHKTSGCLSNADGVDFAHAVAEAGRDIGDSHEW